MEKPTNENNQGITYAATASSSGTVKSFRGSDGIFHVTTPLIESSGLERLCIQTSLRTIKNAGNVLERLSEKLKHKNINLAEDTFSEDLTPNRLVLCMKSQLQAEALLRSPIWLSEREQIMFCVNEPRLWVMTISKVLGFYDQNNYIKSFAARFGVVHRIYRKTLHTQSGKAFGGPNVIVQYTTLFELPPTRIVLDGRYSLNVYWTMPGPDMVHPDKRQDFHKQILSSKAPPPPWTKQDKARPQLGWQKPSAPGGEKTKSKAPENKSTKPPKSVIPQGEIAAPSVIPQGKIAATNNKETNKPKKGQLMNNKSYKIPKVAKDEAIDFHREEPFYIVGKNGKHRTTKMVVLTKTQKHQLG